MFIDQLSQERSAEPRHPQNRPEFGPIGIRDGTPIQQAVGNALRLKSPHDRQSVPKMRKSVGQLRLRCSDSDDTKQQLSLMIGILSF